MGARFKDAEGKTVRQLVSQVFTLLSQRRYKNKVVIVNKSINRTVKNKIMTRHKIVVKRNALGQMAQNTIGTDAFNAISNIPGVADVRIEAEDDEQVEISYSYTLNENYGDLVTHLAKFGLERVNWNQ